MKKKSLSQVLIDAAKDMGFEKATVDRMEELSIPTVRAISAKEVKKIREKIKASQGVFAALLNVNPSTVQKWEQGKVKPQSAALRLLNVIQARGINILQD